MHQDAASVGPGTPAPAGTGWGAPSPPSHSHDTFVCVVSIVQTPPFKNGAYAGSRATLQKNSPLRLRGSRWKARLKMGCFLVCLSFSRDAVQPDPGQGALCAKGIQTKGASHPHPNGFKYKRNGYRISSARSFNVFKD